MAERDQERENEAEEAVEQASPAAIALALRRTSGGDKGIDEDARTFLREQTGLIRLQKEHLHEQRILQLSHMQWRQFSDRMRALLQAMTAAVGLLVAVGVVWMAWSASQERGLVIEAFSVPPDLAQRGLTGDVVASQLEDKLSALQAATESARAAQSYSNDWGHEIKVEIPETGVSISELQRYLRQWLGRETRIGGEVFHAPDGLRLTVRADGEQGDPVAGPEGALDALLEKAAEALFARTQPYRWGVYLSQNGRGAEAKGVYERLAADGPEAERPWGLIGLARQEHDTRRQAALYREAIAQNPDLALAWGNLWTDDWLLGRSEAELQEIDRELVLVRRPDHGGESARSTGPTAIGDRLNLDELVGDDQGAAAEAGRLLQVPDFFGAHEGARFVRARNLALDHDIVGAQTLLAGMDDAQIERSMARFGGLYPPGLALAAVRGDWPAVLQDAKAQEDVWRWMATQPGGEGTDAGVGSMLRPTQALALAHLGRAAEAQALAASMAGDCYDCLRARGVVAALAGRGAEADRWFAEAVRQGPSLPGAHLDWARARLDRGDAAGAIAELKLAHSKGPHFADPLELWGEALMKTGDSTGAAAKFAEAAKYAPNWEKNRQLWRQALVKAGSHG